MQHDFDDIIDHLEQLRAKAEAMLQEHERLVQQIAEAQAQIEAYKKSPPAENDDRRG